MELGLAVSCALLGILRQFDSVLPPLVRDTQRKTRTRRDEGD